MKLTYLIPAIASSLSLMARAEAPAAGDPAKASQIVTQVCAACHGADGNSAVATNPNLAGQHAEYVAKQLANFKSGERKSAVMSGIAANLSDEDIKNLAAYFSEKSPKPGAAKDKELVVLGSKIYRGGNAASGVPACAGCHSPNGAGIPALFPRLSGQYVDYIVAQLNGFRSGDRANDPQKMMRAIALKMTDQEMRAVAEYISGLH